MRRKKWLSVSLFSWFSLSDYYALSNFLGLISDSVNFLETPSTLNKNRNRSFKTECSVQSQNTIKSQKTKESSFMAENWGEEIIYASENIMATFAPITNTNTPPLKISFLWSTNMPPAVSEMQLPINSQTKLDMTNKIFPSIFVPNLLSYNRRMSHCPVRNDMSIQ